MIKNKLFELQNQTLKKFNAKLIPNVSANTVLGIRTPDLKKLAKQLFEQGEYNAFLQELPHTYLEENHLHTFIISHIKDFDECILQVNKFLPFLDNWATCDSFKPTVFRKNKIQLLKHIKEWLTSGQTYTIRFGVNMLMTHFLDQDFCPEYLDLVVNIKSSEYYVNMVRAWYFATALAKHYDDVIGIIEDKKLDVWTHNKTIQKAIESYRICDKQKVYFKGLKIKGESK